MTAFGTDAVLLVIDMQKGFDEAVWGRRNNPLMEARVAELLHAWRVTGPVLVLPMMLAASCATPPTEPAKVATTSTEPGRTPSAAPVSATTQKGIEAGDVNRSIDPCSDFYEYANGTWRAQNPIPTGKPKWSRRDVAREANKQKVSTLVQELRRRHDADPPPTGNDASTTHDASGDAPGASVG